MRASAELARLLLRERTAVSERHSGPRPFELSASPRPPAIPHRATRSVPQQRDHLPAMSARPARQYLQRDATLERRERARPANG
jgi:hypothetical protein